ncbi:two-component system response regulator DegU [Natronobacillus azotifigens]|uniref:Response regulator transcription factor n=1 Tax=Natronobacillus azotifigens TaxID=472978 RepID=A0A9J6RBC7_9BACI|nr:response regulator transcription factor [Natronobacillus azotifigens]MCZ0702984.1 response regulator transcription factor [Natronobacillus azotifigens]
MTTIQLIKPRSIMCTTLLHKLDLACNHISHQHTLDLEQLLSKPTIDLIIIDISILHDPVPIIEKLLKKNLKVAVLIGKQQIESIDRLFQIKIHGYLSEEIEEFELLRAIEIILSNQRYIHYPIATVLQDAYQIATKHEPTTERPPNVFTDREWEVLDLLTKGCSNLEIAEALYLCESTVKNYISNLMKKLDENNRTNVVLSALRHGWFTF